VNSPEDLTAGDGLAEGMIHSEEEAFRQFVVRYTPRLRRYFLFRGMNETEADDAAASCVTDIAMRMDRFVSRGPGSFDHWVLRCAHRLFCDLHGDFWTQAWRPMSIDQVRDPTCAESEPDSPVSEAVDEAVDEAVASLSARDQHVIELRVYEERSYAEISELMGVSESTARIQFYRSLRRLRIVLEASPVIQARVRPRAYGA
jgi:RNA polymerase sigma-70 factor (ECF subfamily)